MRPGLRERWSVIGGQWSVVGMCPAPVQGSADITNLYTARFGAPRIGKKLYISVNQFVDGWEDLLVTFSAIVPAGT